MITKLLHKKRPIIRLTIDGVGRYALLDTGASLSIVNEDIANKGREYHAAVIGAGGEQLNLYYPKDTAVDIWGIRLTNFLVGDISAVRRSIKRETGLEIDMIVGSSDIKSSEMKIDLYNDIVKLGE